jgi:hypothetical protein
MKKFRIGLAIAFFLFIANISFSQPSSWQSRGVGGGGALFFPTINPANDNEFYVACDMSQLFRSTDFGATYSQVHFNKLQVSGMSTYEFTSNSNIAFGIANDGNINYSVRTLDGGTTWTAITTEPQPGDDVYALKADYNNPGRIVINYYNALYFSSNSGNSFTSVKTAANSGAGITLAGVFFDGANIYIGTNEGVLHSSNSGSSFAMLSTSGITAGQAIFSFAGAKSGGTTRFFCITANNSDIYNGVPPYDYYGFAKGVYSMDAGTNTWVAKTTGINFSNDFVMYVGAATSDINTIYLGGSDGTTGGNLVMKTTNAGTSWSKVFLTTNNQNIRTGWSGQGGDRGWGYGESCFGITVAPNNSAKVLFSDFGFVHKTIDGGATWAQGYVNVTDEHPAGELTPPKQYYHSIGIENTTCWQLHWQDANNMFAAFSDINGIRSTDGGTTWSFDYTGHTINTLYRLVKHTTNNTLFAGTSGIHDMYQSTRLQDATLDANDAGGRIIYSTNNGAAWTLLRQFSHPVFWLATDPTNANRLYASVIHYASGAGQGGIWVTNDVNNLASSTWTKLSNPPRTQGHPASIVVLNDGKVVCTYSGRRTSGGTFTASSGVFIYDPVTTLWTDVSDAGMYYWTKDIVIDPTDPTQNTWYVCVFSGWGGAPNGLGGLYKTTNRGGSWTKLTGTQFDRVTSITFNPAQQTQAYLTTEVQGLWISNDMSAVTPTWSLVDNYSFRQPERVFFNPFNSQEVWVTSFGNGLKVGTINIALPVQWVSFSGRKTGDAITLQLQTANEGQSVKFVFEKSRNGSLFNEVKTIAGDGSNQYKCNDNDDAPIVYYRVKWIKAGERVAYSNVIALRKDDSRNVVRVLSNPVNSTIRLEVSLKQPQKLQMILTDMSGKLMMQMSREINAGTTQFSLVLPSSCSNGVYILKVEGKYVKQSLRLVIAR